MAITLLGAGVMLGSIALFEGLAALLEHIEGDPEADVTTALRQLAASNQRRAFSVTAGEQAGVEHLQQKFARFNRIPTRLLTQAALDREGPEVGGPVQNTDLLNMIHQRLGIPQGTLGRVSSPSRMGDTSSIFRQLGKPVPPGPAPLPPPGERPSGLPQQQ